MNIILTLLSISFGLIGWFMPKFTMNVLKLRTDSSNLGMSEISAASGALFVMLGAAALWFNTDFGYAMQGFAYSGAALGRITSIIRDNSGEFISWSFFCVEAFFAAYLILANL